ncbi:TPA: hypothetical protein VAP34_002031 [Streptococcus agalactiae]|nr:hypothetical protein [Streptococcus agalactiae]
MNTNNSKDPGKVVIWKMTEEERLQYISKHPIIPMDRHRGSWKWPKKQGVKPLERSGS